MRSPEVARPVTGANVSTPDMPVVTELLRQLKLPCRITEPMTVGKLPAGPERTYSGVGFDSLADAAALAHALPLDQTIVRWHDQFAVHDALPGSPSKRGRRVVLIDGRPVTVWREIGVAVGMGEVPPTPWPPGVYFAALDSDVRWLQRDISQHPSEDELNAMPAEEVAELWEQAQRGWPAR